METFRLTVAEHGGTRWFKPDPGLAEGHLTTGSGKNRIAVDVVSLDEFFSEHGWPPVDPVKMDLEGSEGAAVKGMAQLAKKNKQMRLIMEMSHNALRRTNTSTCPSGIGLLSPIHHRETHEVFLGRRWVAPKLCNIQLTV